MMHRLVAIADTLRLELPARLENSFRNRNAVQGAVLEIDPFWYTWAIGRYYDLHYPYFFNWKWYSLFEEPINWDFNDRPKQWDAHCRSKGLPEGLSPVIIRVILNREEELPSANTNQDVPREFNGHPVLYEARPRLVATNWFGELFRSFAAKPNTAVSVGRRDPSTSGTLGGALYSRAAGKVFLVSCAHVLGPDGTQVYSPGPFENHECVHLGNVSFSRCPPLKQDGQRCNLAALPEAGRIDLAVASANDYASDRQLLTRASPDSVATVASMSPYQRVHFCGKESGYVDAQLGNVTVWHEIDFENFGDGPAGTRCFGSIFELTDLYGDEKGVARSGDSGAWIYSSDTGELKLWNGMLLGRQGRRAYGCYAEEVMNAIRNEAGYSDIAINR
jgi:hypothetical protein